MSESTQGEGAGDEGKTAGALLRAARESRGLHIAALAAAIKVSPRKLDALECDRLDELPDATFARALASTVCRTLKVDPEEILSRMPAVGVRLSVLEEGREGLNAPFEARSGRMDSGARQTQRVLILAGLALVLAAAVLVMLPPGVWRSEVSSAVRQADTPAVAVPAAPAPGIAASAAEGPGAPASAAPMQPPGASTAALTETVHAAPVAEAAASRPGASVGAGAWIRVSEPSWVEAVDPTGRTVLSRVLQPGESVRLDPAQALKVTIGNASSTQVELRGQALDLRPFTRENVARLELK